ncbi:MAG: SAM-dependent methyltransferase [Flavobacteriaceae bacterium]|nr:SAM-dependent methyltransferase [Flavobacteriaceae bacterium]
MTSKEKLYKEIEDSFAEFTFVNLTLSSVFYKSNELVNVYIRPVKIKEENLLSFTYRYKTNDIVKNYSDNHALIEIFNLLDNNFRKGVLFIHSKEISIYVSKKRELKYSEKLIENKIDKNKSHDIVKKRKVVDGLYLHLLGVTDSKGNVIPKMSKKYKQIDKYLEIIDNLIESNKNLPKDRTINIVDMGSGKGYLTISLYVYLTEVKKLNVSVVGVELRSNLVDLCNNISDKCGFTNVKFEETYIEDYDNSKIDILIALHACDTATDDAIKKGIVSEASIIVCAPCCHKQLRKDTENTDNPILKHGIFNERYYEMLTDAIRGIVLEKYSYTTKIFEFISNEHTRKNILLVANKSTKKVNIENINTKLEKVKNSNNIKIHYLETILQK